MTNFVWDPPSPRVADLIRTGASMLLAAPAEILAEVDAAVLTETDSPINADPVLAAAVQRNNHANLIHWAQSNVRDPGAPVAPQVGDEQLSLARDVVRRGLDGTALHGYRTGQNVGWQRWMDLSFELTQDPGELRELLEVSARSIFTYVDASLTELTRRIDQERDSLTRGTHAQRLEVVSLILEGAPISIERASTRLAYSLSRRHTAAIVWTEGGDPSPERLEHVAEAVGAAAGTRPLVVLASASSRWVWVSGSREPDLGLLREALADAPGVRIALGPRGSGIDGFRRSHLDALATQRLMHRTSSALGLATYDEVQVVALATQDEERADEFIRRTLGEFADAPAELRETARVYLREQSNASATARGLFTHRNTVLSRLSRMEAQLPAPLAGRVLPVALALEILHWRSG